MGRINQINLEFNPAQEEFYFADEYNERAFFGGWGSGKSFCCGHTVLKYCTMYPGSHWWVCRKTIPEIKDTVWKDFVDDIIPADWIIRKNETDRILHIKTAGKPSVIHFKGLDDLGKIESANLSGIYIDQVEEIELAMVNKLRARLRRKNAPLQYLLVAGNPKPGWCKKRYHDGMENRVKLGDFSSKAVKTLPAIEGKSKETKVFVVDVSTQENRANLPEDYIDQLYNNNSESIIKRFIEGTWLGFSGTALEELDQAVHYIESFSIPRTWKKWMALDYGYTNPFCVLVFAKDGDDVVHVVDEWYASKVLIPEHCTKIKDFYLKYFKTGVAEVYHDPSICKRDRTDGKSVLIEIEDELFNLGIGGNIALTPGQNSEAAGVQIINKLFKNNKLYVFRDKCPNTCRELPEIRYKDVNLKTMQNKNETEELRDKDNHTFDVLKYGLNNSRIDSEVIRSIPLNREDFKKMDIFDPDYEKYEDMYEGNNNSSSGHITTVWSIN